MNLLTLIYTLLICSAFLKTLSSGYMVYNLQSTSRPSTSRHQYHSTKPRNANSERSLLNYLFGSDMVIPTEPLPSYYREPTYSIVRYFDDMFDRQFKEFDDFFLDNWHPSRSMMMPFHFSTPATIDIDIKENPKEYVLRADVPGVKKQDIQLSVSQGILKISAERKSEGTSDDGTYARQERSYGKTSRSLQLPEGVDEDKIKAQYQDGVISLTIPKKTNVEGKPKVKRIDISSTKPDIAIPSTVASAIVSKDEVTTSRASIATDSERSSELLITEDDKLPTDGPAQDMTNEPTLVHSSYA